MIKRLLLILVVAQFVLLVALPVLLGGYALASATRDPLAGTVLWWCTMADLMLIVVDTLLLVGALGVGALVRADREELGGTDTDRR